MGQYRMHKLHRADSRCIGIVSPQETESTISDRNALDSAKIRCIEFLLLGEDKTSK